MRHSGDLDDQVARFTTFPHANMLADPDETAASRLHVVPSVLAALMAVGLWNVMVMALALCLTMNACLRRTLYFWSMVAATGGVAVCMLTQVLNVWVPAVPSVANVSSGSVGWVFMVTGQSLVLYSRLHLLGVGPRVRRCALAMIVTDAITMHVPVIVLVFLREAQDGPDQDHWAVRYRALELSALVVFSGQELILSGLYLCRARYFMRKHGRQDGQQGGAPATQAAVRAEVVRIMLWLTIVSVVAVLLNVVVLLLEFLGMHLYQLVVKNFVYSVKLMAELMVLEQLRRFVRKHRGLELDSTVYQHQRRRRRRQEFERQWELALHATFGPLRERITNSLSSARTKQSSAPERPLMAANPQPLPVVFNRPWLLPGNEDEEG